MYFIYPSNVQQKYKHEPAYEILVLLSNKCSGKLVQMCRHARAYIASNDAITNYL